MPNGQDEKDVNFRLGELHGRMTANEKKVDSLEKTMENIDAKLDNIQSTMNKASGGWKTLSIAGGIILSILAVASGLLVKIINFLSQL